MFLIEGKLVSDEVFEEKFVCDLSACKGACCVEGDYGAPLEEEEIKILDQIQDQIAPFLSESGKKVLEEEGNYGYRVELKKHTTTLINGRECAYMTTNEKGIAQCGIETAWRAGATDFRKPISCHLYPIRVSKNEVVDFEALNYDRWDICKAACTLGAKLKIPVYKFLKEPLIRKYGESFYEAMEAAAQSKTAEGEEEK